MTANFMFVSDDKYVKNLGVCSFSVMQNMCPVVDRLRIFVMDCGITEENRERLTRQAARFENAEIVFYDINEKLSEVVPKVPTKWHRAIYGRLFLVDLLDRYDEMERMVYLDSDILMDQPVTELFTMDMQGKCIAGVADADSYERKRALGMAEGSAYINSGVLVIDTVRWAALDASQRIIDYINGFPKELLYPDQDAINYILCDEILLLPPEYNMMWMICDSDIPKIMRNIDHFYYSAEELKHALHHVRICHFAGHDMWTFYGITPIPAKIFKKYRSGSDWRKEKRHFNRVSECLLWLMMSVKRMMVGEW